MSKKQRDIDVAFIRDAATGPDVSGAYARAWTTMADALESAPLSGTVKPAAPVSAEGAETEDAATEAGQA